MRQVLIVGCGDIGLRVAALERAGGASVAALARGDASQLRLKKAGISAVAGDLDQPETLVHLPAGDTDLYYFAPPPGHGTTDPRLRAFLRAMEAGPMPRRIVYISTTGVYGDCAGEWVTEARPPNPQADRSRRRLDAESGLLDFRSKTGVSVVILRVPGIYGPGRLPVERLRSRAPVVQESEAPYSNRIHADDLAPIAVAAMRRGRDGEVYNVSDGHPTTMTDYFNRVPDLLGVPHPPALPLAEASARVSEGMRSYFAESRRLDNRKMLEDLGIELRYPDLDRGLAACAPTEEAIREEGSGKR